MAKHPTVLFRSCRPLWCLLCKHERWPLTPLLEKHRSGGDYDTTDSLGKLPPCGMEMHEIVRSIMQRRLRVNRWMCSACIGKKSCCNSLSTDSKFHFSSGYRRFKQSHGNLLKCLDDCRNWLSVQSIEAHHQRLVPRYFQISWMSMKLAPIKALGCFPVLHLWYVSWTPVSLFTASSVVLRNWCVVTNSTVKQRWNYHYKRRVKYIS